MVVQIKFSLSEIHILKQYFPNYGSGDLETSVKKFKNLNFSNFYFPFHTFNIFNLHLNLTIFVIGNMHRGQAFSKVKVIQANVDLLQMKMMSTCKLHYENIAQINFFTDPLIEDSKIPNFETKHLSQFWAHRAKLCVAFVRMMSNFY